MIHADVWQKTTQFCKAIILQLRINTFFKKEEERAMQSPKVIAPHPQPKKKQKKVEPT